MPLIFLSSTTAGAAGAPLDGNTPPLPPSPWHSAHLSAKIMVPWSEVPPPAGRPAPEGSMSMSQAERSAGVIGLPRLGPSACAALMPRAAAHSADSSKLRVIFAYYSHPERTSPFRKAELLQ